MSSKRTFSKHSSNESYFWQFASQTCGRAHAFAMAYIHGYMQAHETFLACQRGKKHMFHSSWCSLSLTNFSIHRLMFFVLSGFLFLDTNCVCVSVIVYTHEMCVSLCVSVLHVQCRVVVVVALFVFYNLIGCFTRQLIQFRKR